jgi:hypothetical protein
MFCRSDLRIRWKGVVGRKSQSGSENQCRDVWSSNFDGQDRLRLSQPHLSRLHQWGLFDMRRHAFEILCMIFRASALTMLLLAHKRRRRKGVRIANRSRSFWPTRGASSSRVDIDLFANSALLSSARSFYNSFKLSKHLCNFL